MRTDTVFMIGETDFSANVIAGTYNVNDEAIYTQWTDANGRNHRDVYRHQLKGTFDVFFKTVDDFEIFNQTYKDAKADSGLIRVEIMNNSTNQLETKDVYFSFKPVRNRRDDWVDYYETFTIELTEW